MKGYKKPPFKPKVELIYMAEEHVKNEKQNEKDIKLIIGIASLIISAFLFYYLLYFFFPSPSGEQMPLELMIIGLFPLIIIYIWINRKGFF